MGRSPIQTSNERLLLNAESFGFGPSAAVASIFPHLRERFSHIGYAGADHTLDMQTGLAYDTIHDLSGFEGPKKDRVIRELAREYDLFFTAMDFPLLERFKEEGMTTAGYDALAWYWPELPDGALVSDLYLAQDFFGVRERLAAHSGDLSVSDVVPPIVPSLQPRQERSHILINMGGLQNPYWSVDDAALYAKKVTTALRRILPDDEDVKITTSSAVAERIGEQACVYSRKEMKKILSASRFAFMTPGLGNIYDSAVYDIPTIWLPPANDSQGQQVSMLARHEMTDGQVEWESSEHSSKIDYWAEQRSVLESITRRVHEVSVEELEAHLGKQLERVDEDSESSTVALIKRFGTQGDFVVSDRLYAFSLGELGRRGDGRAHA